MCVCVELKGHKSLELSVTTTVVVVAIYLLRIYKQIQVASARERDRWRAYTHSHTFFNLIPMCLYTKKSLIYKCNTMHRQFVQYSVITILFDVTFLFDIIHTL